MIRSWTFAGPSGTPGTGLAYLPALSSVSRDAAETTGPLEVGLKISRRTMSADEQMIRSGYCRDVLETCPILTRLVAEHPRWWPVITAVAVCCFVARCCAIAQ
ncbi:hypothetical protein GCM10029978_051040 [Actinoallomurus acanthiterrae]